MGCGSSALDVGPPQSLDHARAASRDALAFVELRYFTPKMVRAHMTRASLWLVIRERVYDFTALLSAHPGGPGVLLGLGGTDATNDFLEEHADSARANHALDAMLIGHLVDEDDSRAGKIVQEVAAQGCVDAAGFKGSPGAAYRLSHSLAVASATSAHVGVLQSFTLGEVATHNVLEDCWTVRAGQVYDLARYFEQQRSMPSVFPQLDLARVAGVDATKYFDSLPTSTSAVVMRALERGQVGFLAGHSLQNTPGARLRQGSESRPPMRINDEGAMQAMIAIAADDLTHAAAEGLIASPSGVRYLWTLADRQSVTNDTVLLTFDPLLHPSRIASYRATLDAEEMNAQALHPIEYSIEPLSLRAGQHVSVEIPKQVPRENAEERAGRERENRPLDVPFRMQRSYTPLNSWQYHWENPRGQMQLLIKHYPAVVGLDGVETRPAGAGSTYMNELAVGDVITTTSARGVFDIDAAYDAYDTYILLAGGTGLTPLYPVMREIARRNAAIAAAAAANNQNTPAGSSRPVVSATKDVRSSPTFGPSSPSAAAGFATSRVERPKQLILVCCARTEQDQLLTSELDELVDTYRDFAQVFYVLSAPMFSPRAGAFSGQLNMDVLRFVVPSHLQPLAMQQQNELTAPTAERPRAHSATTPGGSGAMLLRPDLSPVRPATSRPRSPSRFTFGMTSRPRADSPLSTAPTLAAKNSTPPPEAAEEAAVRARVALALAQGARGDSRRPSGSSNGHESKALCLVCGPPAFNQTAMSLMYKMGFKRGMGNTNGKDLFVF